MNANEIKLLLDSELEKNESFSNLHGITSGNLSDHLVEPFAAEGWSDMPGSPHLKPGELKRFEFWVVLAECPSKPRNALVVVFIPEVSQWGIAQYDDEHDWYMLQVCEGGSFAGALAAM